MNPQTCHVPPDRGDWPQLRMRHLLDLQFVVAHAKIEIGCPWHNDRPGLNSSESRSEISFIDLVGTDIGMLPGPEHCQQVVRVPAPEIAFQEAHSVLHRCQTHLAIPLFAKEVL